MGGAGRVVGSNAGDAKLAGLLLVGGNVDSGFFAKQIEEALRNVEHRGDLIFTDCCECWVSKR